MALMTNIPPQAYTRDTLVKAIEWLSSQPPSVRERATSADLVVSYYLQARRNAAVQMEAPVSGEVFKNDLKHLAEDLKQFEDSSAPPHNLSHLSSHEFIAQPEPIFKPEPAAMRPVPVAMAPPPPQMQQMPQMPPPPKVPTWPVDDRTLATARELQKRLNLGCESEALRMLVTLGAEKARTLFS